MAQAVDKSNYADLDELGTDAEEITENFMKAADHLKNLVSTIDNTVLLNLYGYYKQGMEGPCNVSKPSWYDSKGKAKWEAWNKLGNMPQIEAQSLYVQIIESIDPNFLCLSTKEGWITISTLQVKEDELSESEKSLVDYVKEGNDIQVLNILTSYQETKVEDIINKLDEDGLGLIHWAADRGSPEVLKIIISFGANVNLLDSDMQTALHYAASCGHTDCIKILLENKADVNVKDADGLDPKGVANDVHVQELLNAYA